MPRRCICSRRCAARAVACRWCSPAPTRSTVTSAESKRPSMTNAMYHATVKSRNAASARRWRSALPRPMAAQGRRTRYVHDYARSFGIPAVVLRMSCIGGPRQFGTEDQGRVAHFLLRALGDDTLTVYGDGRQVRDVLHVHDAVRAWMSGAQRCREAGGRRVQSRRRGGQRRQPDRGAEGNRAADGPRRPAHRGGASVRDQLWFVSDTTKLAKATGWRATIRWQEGLADLMSWLEELSAHRQRAVPAELRSVNA